MSAARDEMLPPDSPRAAAEILAGLERDRARATAALEPDARLLYATWGTSWSVGFGVLWAARSSSSPLPVAVGPAVATFGLLMVAAVVVTAVHLGRTMSGLQGASSTAGAMLGATWLLGFGALAALMGGARRAGADEALLDLLWPTASGLVVGLLYLATGALWSDRLHFGLGAWILLTSSAGALVGLPGVLLVMSVSGGGGFLLAAAVIAVRARPGSRTR